MTQIVKTNMGYPCPAKSIAEGGDYPGLCLWDGYFSHQVYGGIFLPFCPCEKGLEAAHISLYRCTGEGFISVRRFCLLLEVEDEPADACFIQPVDTRRQSAVLKKPAESLYERGVPLSGLRILILGMAGQAESLDDVFDL